MGQALALVTNAPASGWAIGSTAFAANFMAFGTLFSFGVYLTPLATEFDTSTGPVAALFSGSVCLYYVGGAIGGRYSDRRGARPVVTAGAIAMTIGLLGASRATALWQVYLTFGLFVGLAAGFCYPALIGLIGRRFEGRHRATVLGILLAGVGSGTLVMPSAFQYLIARYGWRTTFAWLSAAALVAIGSAAVTSDRLRGERAPLMKVRTLLGSRRFRRFYLAVVALGPGFYAPIVFYNDYAIAQGIGAGRAALLVGISGACSIVGRLASGVLSGWFSPLTMCRGAYGLLGVSLVVWLVSGGSYALLVASALIHGTGWAVWVTATPPVLADWFGVENLGGVIGLHYTGLGVGALFGPALCGFIIDRAGFIPAIALVLATTAIALAAIAVPMHERP